MKKESTKCQSVSISGNTWPICQSCALIMNEPSKHGTEKDGSLSKEYCVFCYKNGEFTYPDMPIDEIVKLYADKWGEFIGRPDTPLEEARIDLHNTLSHLKRWKNQKKH